MSADAVAALDGHTRSPAAPWARPAASIAGSSTLVDIALGGALLVELALDERVDVAGPDEAVPRGRLVVRDAGPTRDEVLDEALARAGMRLGDIDATLGTSILG